jgi:acyl-CoA hydrolase
MAEEPGADTVLRASDAPLRMIELVFPGHANHHGTLFGGEALSIMDKAAFLAASRRGRDSFVTAGCERIDFTAPAHEGEIVEAVTSINRTGRRSVEVTVDLHAEVLLTGETRLCTRGVFAMVAARRDRDHAFPSVGVNTAAIPHHPGLLFVDMVFPRQTNHYGTLYGGDALALMDKAAFVLATRIGREVFVTAAVEETQFKAPVRQGEMIEVAADVVDVGKKSITIDVTITAENLSKADRREAGKARFILVSVDAAGRSKPLAAQAKERLTQFSKTHA